MGETIEHIQAMFHDFLNKGGFELVDEWTMEDMFFFCKLIYSDGQVGLIFIRDRGIWDIDLFLSQMPDKEYPLYLVMAAKQGNFQESSIEEKLEFLKEHYSSIRKQMLEDFSTFEAEVTHQLKLREESFL